MGQRGEGVDHRAGRDIDAATAKVIDEHLDATDQRMRRLVHRFASWVSMLRAVVEERRQDHAAQLLQRHACCVGSDVDRRQRSTTPITQRCGDGSDAFFELLVDEREALGANRVDLGAQSVDVGDRLRRQFGDDQPVEEPVELFVGQAGQQHAAHRCPRRGESRTDGQRDAHDALGVDPCHVDDLRTVEHRGRHALVDPIRQRLHERLGDVGQLQRRDVGEAEVEHARCELERAAVGAHVTEC